MTAPIASGWSDCRVGFAPTGTRRLFTAHTQFGHLAWIKTGLSNGNLVEVKGNLKPGEQIVTKVVYFLTAPHPGASAVVQK